MKEDVYHADGKCTFKNETSVLDPISVFKEWIEPWEKRLRKTYSMTERDRRNVLVNTL